MQAWSLTAMSGLSVAHPLNVLETFQLLLQAALLIIAYSSVSWWFGQEQIVSGGREFLPV
jgi:hypothetical protein